MKWERLTWEVAEGLSVAALRDREEVGMVVGRRSVSLKSLAEILSVIVTKEREFGDETSIEARIES